MLFYKLFHTQKKKERKKERLTRLVISCIEIAF
jgi:hypothetical protein